MRLADGKARGASSSDVKKFIKCETINHVQRGQHCAATKATLAYDARVAGRTGRELLAAHPWQLEPLVILVSTCTKSPISDKPGLSLRS